MDEGIVTLLVEIALAAANVLQLILLGYLSKKLDVARAQVKDVAKLVRSNGRDLGHTQP